ncbi:MAG TPA: hypothetical protein VKC58_04605 [Myxococcales bacterium]|jgi:hypothetical protein|nr:hypothetical protein [Myxococcales bacterium]
MKPRWIVCEDGDEYLSRFRRFLGQEFEFVPAGDLQDVLRAAPGAAGLLLDLDFRRADPARLVDETGAARADLAAGERRRLAEVQGVLILRALRGRGIVLPALLCADLDDAAQARQLEEELAPLAVVPGSEGVARIGERLRQQGLP